VSAAYQQQQEEMDAARARLERQAALKEEMRRGEVVVALFDPVQNLKRSVDAASKGASMDDTLTGLRLVQAQFMDAFKKLGLEEVPGEGARFDPNLHEALTTIPVTDPAMDEVVIEVFSAGYRIGSRLIAPARVVVGRLVEGAAEA
jgi:molecular chaperone GrpE